MQNHQAANVLKGKRWIPVLIYQPTDACAGQIYNKSDGNERRDSHLLHLIFCSLSIAISCDVATRQVLLFILKACCASLQT